MRKDTLRTKIREGAHDPGNLSYALLFFFMLACNILTPYLADDFTYMFSFQSGERIRNLLDIFPSMLAHAQKMNGRLVTHFLVQLTFLFPANLFDFVNAAMFTFQVYLICRTARARGLRQAILAIAVFFALWLCEPAFGQVNLWQDGSVNYLWSLVFGLLFLQPFVSAFLSDRPLPKGAYMYLLAFLVGAYSETVSAAVIFMAVALLLLDTLVHQKPLNRFLSGLIVTAFIGYVTIYLAPAQWSNKASGGADFMHTIDRVIRRFFLLKTLLASYIVLLVLHIAANTEKDRLLLSGVFFMGSLVPSFLLLFANQYPFRSASSVCVFLICACAVLLEPLLEVKKQPLIVSATLVFMLNGLAGLPKGLDDIVKTYEQVKKNQQIMAWQVEDGIKDVVVPCIDTDGPYSAIYQLKYLDTESAEKWPNRDMAKYYSIDSILGEK